MGSHKGTEKWFLTTGLIRFTYPWLGELGVRSCMSLNVNLMH